MCTSSLPVSGWDFANGTVSEKKALRGLRPCRDWEGLFRSIYERIGKAVRLSGADCNSPALL